MAALPVQPVLAQMTNLEASPPAAPERQLPGKSNSAATGQASPGGDDSEAVFRALYDLKANGWTPAPLKIEILKAKTDAPPAPDTATWDIEATQLLAEFGACEYGVKTFARGQRHINVKVYRFESSDGAYGAYLTFRHGSSTLVLKGDATSQDDKSISLWKDKYFVSVVGAPDDEESMLVVTHFAETLAVAIKASSREPQVLTRIPVLEKVRGSEKIVMGPVGIRRAFLAPYVNALNAEHITTGVVCDYKMQEPYRERLKLLLLQFASQELANKAYVGYLSALQEQHKPQSLDNFMPQSNLFKISGSFLLVQLNGNEVVVITGARKKTSLPSLAHGVY